MLISRQHPNDEQRLRYQIEIDFTKKLSLELLDTFLSSYTAFKISHKKTSFLNVFAIHHLLNSRKKIVKSNANHSLLKLHCCKLLSMIFLHSESSIPFFLR